MSALTAEHSPDGAPHAPARGAPGHPDPGGPTAVSAMLDHRLAKMAPIRGAWLDCGCADGGYCVALLDAGADRVAGVDPEAGRIAAAGERDSRDGRLSFHTLTDERLPFADASFDGVLLNEVLEHVENERATLAEIARVLRPGGRLVLYSPNRFFPAEGHGLRLSARVTLGFPVPLVPWLPERLTARFMRARNYWPSQLQRLVEESGLEVKRLGTAFPQFAMYSLLPERVIAAYRTFVPIFERMPVLRWFGVSVFIEARRPGV
ncbi:MAG: hypothetical protein QOG15_1521 [Solirubrobacteraceae bacterium]|nr:hypothetical protein [Solirubrobacteraceae bacterium]